MEHAALVSAPCVQVISLFDARSFALRTAQFGLDTADNRLGNFILNGKNVRGPPVVASRPNIAAVIGSDELLRGPDAVAGAADASHEDITNAELSSDFFRADSAALVCESRTSGDHEKPANPRERGNDFFRDPVDERILIGLAAHIAEWKNGDGRLCRHAKRRRARLGGRHRLLVLDVDRGDEAKAFLGECPNEALLVAAVANGPAHRIYPAGQRRFRNNSAAPNRGDEVVLADDTVTIFHQINQHIEDLRFESDKLAAAAQFAPVGVQQAVFESYLHDVLFALAPKRL